MSQPIPSCGYFQMEVDNACKINVKKTVLVVLVALAIIGFTIIMLLNRYLSVDIAILSDGPLYPPDSFEDWIGIIAIGSIGIYFLFKIFTMR